MMKTFKPKMDKDLKDYLQDSKNVNVILIWSDAISIADFEKSELSSEESGTICQDDVIYIFWGKDKHDHDAMDVGLTTRALDVRTKEHLSKGDYLEGYPYSQEVYCGKIEAKVLVDRDLLEQVEGVIIQTLGKKIEGLDDTVLCNDSKRKASMSKYKIGHIYNNNVPKKLIDVLPVYIPEND